MAVVVAKTGKVIVEMLEAELRTAGVDMSDPASSVAWSSQLQQVTVNAPAATTPQLALIPSVVAAHTASTPIQDYAASHLANRRTFARILYVMDDGIRNNAATLANIRTTLTSTLAVIATLPAAYTAHFDKMRTLHGVTADPSTLTLVQCAELEDAIRSWCNTRLLFALIASEALD